MQIRMFAEEAADRRRRDLYLMGVATRYAGATEAGWKQFQKEFEPK